MYCFIIGKFSTVGSHGKVGGSEGGRDLVGQEHGWSVEDTTPLLVHFRIPVMSDPILLAVPIRSCVTSTAPCDSLAVCEFVKEGKLAGNVCNFLHASLERKIPWILFDT